MTNWNYRSSTWALCRLPVVCALTLVIGGLISISSRAQVLAVPSCVSHPDAPTQSVVVPGFPEQRLYIYRKSPLLCTESNPLSCVPSAYVVAGDKLLVSATSCDGWSYAHYNGKQVTSGWVISTAVGRASDSRRPTAPNPGSKVTTLGDSVGPVCRVAQNLLNSGLKHHNMDQQTLLPSALQNRVFVNSVPGQTGADLEVWGGATWDVRINGRRLKAVTYSSGGTCHDENLELWNKTFTHQFPIAGSNADDGGSTGYSSEDIVTLVRKPYFVHYSRSARTVTLSYFTHSLVALQMCTISQVVAPLETIQIDHDPALSQAQLHRNISGAPMYDIQPYIIASESFGFSEQGVKAFDDTLGPYTIVARGRLDIDNDGQVDEVGILEFQDGTATAGCGHDVETWVPIKLNSDGMPKPGSQFNLKSIEQAEPGEDVRLFEYRGKTYLETRTRADADGLPRDIVWELSRQGRRKLIEYVPVRYEAQRVSNP